jgi:1-phosphofructokinase family hexose kinase
MITVVSLSPAVDVTYEVAELVEGHTHRPTAVHRHPGGKGANVARAAATMGAEVRLVTLLPPSASSWFADEMAAHLVALHCVDSAAPLRSCVSVASAATGLMTEVYEHPAELTEVEAGALVDLVHGLQESASGWLVLSGSVPPGVGTSMVGELLRRTGPEVNVAVDTHGRALQVAVEHRPQVLKVNRAEAAALAGPEHHDAAPGRLADLARRRTGGAVIVTDSVRGAVAAEGASAWTLGPPPMTGGFSQGSGDAFLGGLLAALDRGVTWPEALRQGAGCGTANALVPGGGRFDPLAARALARDSNLVTTTS